MLLMAWLKDFRDVCTYVRDPHGWEQRRRRALRAKYKPRPSLVRVGDDFWCHPSLKLLIANEINGQNKRNPLTGSALHFFGTRIVWTPLAVENPPEDGWPDIVVPPERPRLMA